MTSKQSAKVLAERRDALAVERERIGAAVRAMRMELGVSQGDFADRLQVHRVTYIRFEQGKNDLGLSHLRDLEAALADSPHNVHEFLMNFQLGAD